MSIKLKNIITFVITVLFLSISQVYAVDTTECFAPGIATDFEAYYSYGWNKDGKAHGFDFLIGGGFTETLSYYIAGAFSKDVPDSGDSFTNIGGFGIGLFWTPYEKEKFISIDILPLLFFEPNDVADDGKSAKPDFKGMSFSCAAEINFIMMEKFQPYIIIGYAGYRNDVETTPDEFESSPDEFPIAAGFMIPAAEGIEVLGQIDWLMNEDSKKWTENERSFTVGVNIMLKDNLELITELSRSLEIIDENGETESPAGWGASIGAIYAL
jgi:opacity protein-like surface antigen